MHDEEGPRRLRQGADTPEPLLRALSALRKGVDDSARLQRVGQKLEAALGSQPSAAGLAARRGLFGQKLSGLKLILGGLGVLAPLLIWQLMDDVTPVPPRDHEGSPLPSAAPEIAEKVEPKAPVIEPTATPEPAAEALAVTPTTKRAPRSGHAAVTKPRKSRERERASSAEVSEPSAEPVRKAENAEPPQAAVASAAVEPVEAPAATPAPRPEPKPKPAAAPEAPRMSEAELLLKARQALKRDPELTLRLASEHQAQYARGRLAPEREVLAIEALRNLGRKAEAEERLRKFEARYPDSIHLERLREAR